MRAARKVAVAVAVAACAPACVAPRAPSPAPAAPPSKDAQRPSCATSTARGCDREVDGLLRAASAFGNVRHEYLLDPASSLSPGRGVARGPEGTYRVLPTRCADERAPAPSSSRVDASTVDFTYVGVAVDRHLVSADADLAPWLSAGAESEVHSVSLVALAFVRDLDPQFFAASSDVAFSGEACTCGEATHFVGAVKTGGMLAYEIRARGSELRGRALDFVKARLSAADARVTQTVVGGLEVGGLERALDAATGAPALTFRVRNPVPIAYAVFPLSDVCRFSFPTPEVSPEVVDFGDVPYGLEATRLLHVVNRASVELRASVGGRTFAVPALGSADVSIAWTPAGQQLGCEAQTREDTLAFVPRDADAPVTPKTQSVRVVSRVRTGKPTFRRHEHVDTGVHRKPDYASTVREWTCPPDYALASCRTERAECSDGRCLSDGYAVNAAPSGNGCRFACQGPEGLLPGISANFCRFDAVMECRLRCK